MATVIPVDLSKTGGRMLQPGMQPLQPDDLISSILKPGPGPTPRQPQAVVPPPAAPEASKPGEPGPAEEPQLKKCRHCGSDPEADPFKIDVEDLVEFAKSVWRNEPFRKSYVFFGGAVAVQFRSLTTEQIDVSKRAVFADAAKVDTSGGLLGMLALNDLIEEHQFGFAVESLQVSDKRYKADDKLDSRKVLEDVKAVIGNHIAYQAVRTTYQQFHVLTSRLIAAGANPSFWEATVPSGPSPVSPTTATRG